MMTFATPIPTPTQPHSADISENHMRMHIPEILEILLIDRTTSTSGTIKNIIWANENYIAYGEQHYAATSPIKIDLITGEHTPHHATRFKIARITKRTHQIQSRSFHANMGGENTK
ncbi:hypothetical protein QG034_08355 [Kingella kingae]|uniref:hypothetical protein n=1 Tax=Kingella kingae TaxID=504 RepID=UPI0025503138|nr:hypothetical protein [Kingella kingae]MDK4526903.1 hypothetical protein [Kingella kingae]MDK4532951.1 hypothetical protein [Kingella kingae]